MKTDIILSGVGGQGILTIAAAIGHASLQEGLYVKQSEVHGMSQRGGAVQSHMRISSEPIASDLIPLGKADLILSVEPMEALRYLPYLSNTGWLITSSVPFINIPDYPDLETIFKSIRGLTNHILVDADQIAKDCGSPKASNIVMLGVASAHLGLSWESLQKGVERVFSSKGAEVVDSNLRAIEAGKAKAV
jgi:indolepyruvate ferredoxin oxidoreductase beta subunit